MSFRRFVTWGVVLGAVSLASCCAVFEDGGEVAARPRAARCGRATTENAGWKGGGYAAALT